MLIDVQSPQFDWRAAYKVFLGFICPRPIALVSTVAADGSTNLAPFSFYNMVSANPPVVVFCAALDRNRQPKHSLLNARATGEFVIAAVDESIAPQMVRTAAEIPYGQSEFTFSGLTPAPARYVRAPLVREARVNMECRLRQVLEIADLPGSGQLVFGDVLAVHVADAVLKPTGDAIDPATLRMVGRLGEQYYCTVRDAYELHIPKV
jgi:flavin reductase (DIM6/NTAB) family NADH-FMN oxidoreductase RutF